MKILGDQRMVAEDASAAPALYRLWVTPILFKKNGFPSLGTFGRTEGTAVIMRTETWRRLCQDVPQLQTTQFEVGSQD